MRVIPVIDLQHGLVVRGIAGERSAYRPIQSQLVADARPATTADVLVTRFGFRTVYVADLDAIAGHEPNWDAFDAIAGRGLQLMVDAGIGDIERACKLIEHPSCGRSVQGLVMGMESLASTSDLAQLARALDPERAIFSLDLRGGRPLTTLERWKDRAPEAIADEVLALGFRRLIVLDLASVGIRQGPNVLGLCQNIRRRHSHIELISGGGVRELGDVYRYVESGCDAVLVASALHDGNITPQDLLQLTIP